MATGFDGIVSSGGFKPATVDTPLDVRTRIKNISEVESIPAPFIGMIFYVIDEDMHYKVQSLTSKLVGIVTVPNAKIDRYSPLFPDISYTIIQSNITEI